MHSRRAYLATTATALAASIAGCGGGDSDDSDGEDGGGDDGRDSGSPAYLDWIAESMAAEQTEVVSTRPSSIVELPAFKPDGQVPEIFGTSQADIDRMIQIQKPASLFTAQNLLWMFRGDMTADDTISFVESRQQLTFEQIEDYEGYAVHSVTEDTVSISPEDELFLGFKDDIVVFSTNRDFFEGGIDAHAGSGNRLVDSDDRLGLLAGALGDGDRTRLRLDQALGDAAVGYGGDFSEDESDLTFGVVHADEATASENESNLSGPIEDTGMSVTDTTVDGRLVTLSVTGSTQEIAQSGIGANAVNGIVTQFTGGEDGADEEE
jgi:hypothetical protein